MMPKAPVRGVLRALVFAVLALAGSISGLAAPVKLVVIVSVDGLSWQRLKEYEPWYDGGLKRLLTEGQVETNCNYGHLNTETCPGHASLSTGAPPAVHGIVTNDWYVKKSETELERFYCAYQDAPPVNRGPQHLRVPTLGDVLIGKSPGSRVVSLSGKDRSAIYLAGREPSHVVYWYDRNTGRYVTSSAYTGGDIGGPAKQLVDKFTKDQAGDQLVQRFGTLWKPLLEPAKADLPRPEPNIGQYQTPDLGIGFDHNLAINPTRYFTAIYNSPFQDQLLADLALAVLADPTLALGRRGVPDLLALSFSAQDTVSHNYGYESEETLDTLRRLDVQLSRLLAALDSLAKADPAGQVVLALSADHGFTPLPEVVRRKAAKANKPEQRIGGRLMSPGTDAENAFPNFLERLNRALIQDLGLPAAPKPLLGVEGWNLYYDPRVPKTKIDGALKRVTLQMFGEEIEDILLISERASWLSGKAADFARKDFDAERSGDAFLIPKPYVLMHWDPVRGSGHGSHHEYDTNVPLIFWGAPFKAGERSEPAAPYDLAPTLADVLGIPLPDATGTSRLSVTGTGRP